MANTVIQLKRSVVSGNVPLDLLNGEIALNSADGILFYKDDVGSIKSIKNSKSFSTVNVNSTLLVSTTPDDILNFNSDNGISVSGDFFTDTITISGINASTSQKGVVQLLDGVYSNSISLAATANSVNAAYSLALSAYNKSSGGTIDLTYQEFIASSGQTDFSVEGGYIVGKLSLYVNGVLLGSTSTSLNFGATSAISISRQWGNGGYPYAGYVSNLRSCLGSIPTSYQTIDISGNNTISGNINGIPNNLKSLFLQLCLIYFRHSLCISLNP